MNKLIAYLQHTKVTLLLLFFLNACTPLIGPYSPTAYENATSLKPQTLALMDKANKSYSTHKEEITKHTVALKEAHEFVAGIPSNSISAQQWEILIKDDGDLYGKFVKRWKERSTLSDTFITEFKGVISDAFDEIICLEANKKESSACKQTENEGE